MVELKAIAARLDNDERLRLTYRFPSVGGQGVVRTDRLLDVAEESGLLFVDQGGIPVWVKLEEVIEVVEDTGT